MRIPNLSLVNDLQRYVELNRKNYSEDQVKISSGKKYLKQSENPVASDEITQVKQENSKTIQWRENIARTHGWETTTESYLDTLTDLMHRARELGIESDSVVVPRDLENMAIQMDELLEQMVQISNSNYVGNPIFAGAGVDPAFNDAFEVTRDANDKITAVTYRGSSNRRQIQIADTAANNTVEYGLTGDELFQQVPAAYPGDPNFSMFDQIIKIRDHFAAGEHMETFDDVGNNPLHLRGDFAKLDAAFEHVVEKVVTNSVNQKKLQTLLSNNNVAEESGVNRLSELQDLDMAAAISELKLNETALQASLQMVGRINSMSIINYI